MYCYFCWISVLCIYCLPSNPLIAYAYIEEIGESISLIMALLYYIIKHIQRSSSISFKILIVVRIICLSSKTCFFWSAYIDQSIGHNDLPYSFYWCMSNLANHGCSDVSLSQDGLRILGCVTCVEDLSYCISSPILDRKEPVCSL